MKVRMTASPFGFINGYISIGGRPLTEWPPVGAVVDLPDVLAEDLIKGGNAEKVSGWSGREWLWPWQRPQAKPDGPTHTKLRIKVRPAGYISLDGGPLGEWPKVGAVVDLPTGIAEGLIAGGFAESVVDEVRPTVVRLKVKRSWPKVGAVVELPEAIARDLVDGGLADELVD